MKLPSRLPVPPGRVIFLPALWQLAAGARPVAVREAIAGLLATAGFVVLVAPLSFSLLPAVLFAALAYVGLRLLLMPPPETADLAEAILGEPAGNAEPPQPPAAPVPPNAAPLVLPAGDPAPFGLTKRELEILPLLAQRATDHEIAELLSISERTVMNHVSSILGKLGLKSRREVGAFIEQHRDRFRLPPPKPR